MELEKEFIELYGFILGDGTHRKGKYNQMTFYNSNLELMKYIQDIIEKINGKVVNVNKRKRKTGIEYSINISANITKKLVELGFNKERIPAWILKSEYGIYFLKAFFECEGSLNNSQIMIHQKNKRELLEDCIKIANKFGLSAHVHNSSKNREFDYYLAIEDTEKIINLFGKTIKPIVPIGMEKGSYYYTTRKILEILNGNMWLTTSQIRNELQKNGVNLSKVSKVLVRKHLKPLSELGIISRQKDITLRDNKGCILRLDSSWKINGKLTHSEILNFPYGVAK